MKAVAQNLKQILLCPPLWFWHLVGAVVCIAAMVHPLSSRTAGEGHFSSPLLVPLWSALFFASILKELCTRPFAFVLPGHRKGVRGAILVVGSLSAAAAALTVWAYPGFTPGRAAAAFIAYAGLGFTLYLLVTAWVFAIRNPGFFIGFLIGSYYLLEKIPASRRALERAACAPCS